MSILNLLPGGNMAALSNALARNNNTPTPNPATPVSTKKPQNNPKRDELEMRILKAYENKEIDQNQAKDALKRLNEKFPKQPEAKPSDYAIRPSPGNVNPQTLTRPDTTNTTSAMTGLPEDWTARANLLKQVKDEKVNVRRETVKSDVASSLGIRPDMVDIDKGLNTLQRAKLSFSKKSLSDLMRDEKFSKKNYDDYMKELNSKFKSWGFKNGKIWAVPVGDDRRLLQSGDRLGSSNLALQMSRRSGWKFDPKSTVFVYKKDVNDPNEKVKLVDEYGVTTADVFGDTAGDLPQLAGAIGTSFLPGGVIRTGLQVGAGAFAGDVGRKLINAGLIGGSNPTGAGGLLSWKGGETLIDSLYRAAPDALFAGGVKGVGKLINAFRGKGIVSDDALAFLQDVKKAKDMGIKLENFTLNQISDAKVAERLAKQGLYFDAKTKRLIVSQVEKLAKNVAGMGVESLGKIGKEVQTAAKGILNRETDTLKEGIVKATSKTIGRKNIEVGATGLKKADKNVERALTAREGASWKKVDNAVAKEKPVFDTRDSKATVAKIFGENRDTSGKVQTIMDKIGALDNTTTNFSRIKDIRSDLNALNKSLNENVVSLPGVDRGAIKRLTDKLTTVLKNPVNKSQTPYYLQAFDDATKKSSTKYRYMESQFAKEVRPMESPNKFVEQYSKPGSISPKRIAQIRRYSPTEFRNYKSGIVDNIMKSDGKSIERLGEWKGYPSTYKTMFSQAERNIIEKNAEKLDNLVNRSNISKAIKEEVQAGQAVGKMLDLDNITGLEAQKLMDQFKGNKALLRRGIVQHIIDKTIKDGPYKLQVTDPKLMNDIIYKLKKSKLWQALSEPQRTKLEGMNSYAKLVGKGGALDSGSSLEGASLIANLTTISKFLPSAIQIGLKQRLVRLMASDKINNFLLNSLKKKTLNFRPLIRTGIMLDVLNDNVETVKKQDLKFSRKKQ